MTLMGRTKQDLDEDYLRLCAEIGDIEFKSRLEINRRFEKIRNLQTELSALVKEELEESKGE
jgi:ribosomal 50S subunit-associated protein YjgA (DUF615 family)